MHDIVTSTVNLAYDAIIAYVSSLGSKHTQDSRIDVA